MKITVKLRVVCVEQMSLWVDKYRPRTLDGLEYHEEISKRLKALASSGDFPHLLIYGPSGAGKKTRILATLHELYGIGMEKMKIDVRTFKTPTNRKLEFNIVSSLYHIEITPSDLGNNDRIIIQDLLKEIGQTEQIDFQTGKHRFKVVIINEADSLSRDAQAALRRTMEKYSSNLRLVLISSSTSNIIAPIKSRTLLVRVALPLVQDIVSVLRHIAKEEEVTLPTNETASFEILSRVAEDSQRNLRRAILSFEALAMTSENISATSQLVQLDWEQVISRLALNILKDRSVRNLAQCRTVLYELITHCIPAKVILKSLMLDLVGEKLVSDAVKLKIVEAAALFDERLSLGNKDIFHLEGFIAKVMVILEEKM